MVTEMNLFQEKCSHYKIILNANFFKEQKLYIILEGNKFQNLVTAMLRTTLA